MGVVCGRYTNTPPAGTLGRRFEVELESAEGTARFNIAPTEEILAVVPDAETSQRRARMLRWGLLPGGARSLKVGARMINARVETAARRPPFAALIAGPGRCLILADGFYEWMRSEDPRQPRQPFRFTVDGGSPFAFAGLWTQAKLDGVPVASATILTTAPNDLVARVHDRMPAILPSTEAEAAWLSPALGAGDVLELCAALPSERMSVAAVSRRVNSVASEEDASLLEPDAADSEPAPAQKTLL